jgi:ADP-ribosylglycohydrolase
MQLSSTGGAGRGSDEGDIIGSVILHDKKQYWQRGGQYHYHHTLAPGENTLEASLGRVLMQSLLSENGSFSSDKFRSMYIEFMTTPGTHNDTYASTCHRMFFKNWKNGVPPEKCPDNDDHNVDTMDGLVLPMIVLVTELGAGRSTAEASASAAKALSVTRRSSKLVEYINAAAEVLAALLSGSSIKSVVNDLFPTIAQEVKRRDSDPMVACYIDGGFPALLFFAHKYGQLPVGEALLASANAGGENVHRGAVLGTILGFSSGMQGVSDGFRKGLTAHSDLEAELANVVAAVRNRRNQQSSRPDL